MPDLPIMTATLIIPDFHTAEISVKPIGEPILIDNIIIPPSKGNIKRNVNPNSIQAPYGPVYQNNKFYPAKQAYLRDPHNIRNVKAQTVVFYPYTYNPITKTLKYYTEYEVTIIRHTPVDNGLISVDPEFKAIYKSLFLNYTEAKFNPVGDVGEMLIISHPEYIQDIQPLVNWKNRKGIPTKIVNVLSLGVQTPENIRNFIQNYASGHNLKFVLLAGDIDKIPSFPLHGGMSDIQFGCLTGNDSYPEVFVGRFSPGSVADLQTMVAKTLQYEQSPDISSDHYAKSVTIASEEGAGIGDDNEIDWQHARNLQSQLLQFTYTQKLELYDGSQGEADSTGNPVAADLVNVLNSGVGILNYTGHGWEQGIATTGFSNTEIGQLTNGNKLPFAIIVGCVTGAFQSGTCFGEEWTRKNGGGGVAGMMATINQSWAPPMEGQDAMINIITGNEPGVAGRSFAGMAYNGCMRMNDVYGAAGVEMTDTWICFGDPSLLYFTKTPDPMTVSHIPATPLGNPQVTVNVDVDGALVGVSQNNQLLGYGYVTGGVALINLSPAVSTDSLDIVVTAFNRIPYFGKMAVQPSNGPFVICTDTYINDTAGNNNSLADNAETVSLDVVLSNLGLTDASSAIASLHTNDPYITLVDSVATWNSLTAGNNFSQIQAFTFTVSPVITDQHQALFTITTTDDAGNSHTITLTVVLNAPVLSVPLHSYTDSGGDGMLQSGETVTFILTNLNSGHAQTQQLNGLLSDNSTWLDILSGVSSTSPISPGNTGNCTFTAQINPQAPQDTEVQLTYSVSDGFYTSDRTFNVLINATVETWETGDMTSFNWINTGTAPWFVDNSVSFGGTHSLRSGATTDDGFSTLEITRNVQVDDTIRFMRKVSSEETYDFLRFYIDGIEKDSWSGEIDWTESIYPVPPGNHTFRWTYIKDYTASAGSDAAWIDNIRMPVKTQGTGIVNPTNIPDIVVFPNPTADYVQLSGNSEAICRILDLQGRCLFSTKISDKNRRLSLESLASGSYLIQIQSNNKLQTVKICKL